MRKTPRRDTQAGSQAEIEPARPYLDLARAIQEDVGRIVEDTATSAARISELIDAIPARERLEAIRSAFGRLSPERQWEAIEQAFGDEEIRAALAEERAARLDLVRRNGERASLARKARAEGRLDTHQLPRHDTLTLGLYREGDVRAALDRGRAATTCARRLVLRSIPSEGVRDGTTFSVLEDTFNPAGGYFVTAEYDRQVWEAERLPPHAPVRAGSISDTRAGRSFEPVLYPGGRADFEIDGELRPGRLHIGYVLLGEEDVFAQRGDRGRML